MTLSRFPSVVVLFLFLSAGVPLQVKAQTLLLPGPREVAVGKGACEGVEITIANENWRVRKGDTFEVKAVQLFGDTANLRFQWTVDNGKIVSGQGTNWISIKAGGAKTPGYINVSGFVRVRLNVRGTEQLSGCQFEIAKSVMIGKHREHNGFANVTHLKLDETEINHPCSPGTRPFAGRTNSEDMIVAVESMAVDPENDILTYAYRVSGGTIIGTGARVKWDLTGVPPGTYTIAAGVDDGSGILGITKKQIVTVTECDGCGLIECPTIEIAGPAGDMISAGNNTFTANVSGGTQPSLTYEWIVNNGEIVSGQNTPSIVVRLTEMAVSLPTSITLRIGGVDPRGDCIVEQELIFENGRRKL